MFKHTECITPEYIDTLDLTSLRKHISDFQSGHSRETTKGVQIACQIDFDFEGTQKQMKTTFSQVRITFLKPSLFYPYLDC